MTPLPGVRITGIIHRPVLCRLLLTGNVRTANLIIKVVKKTGREPAANKDMSTPVLRDGFMPPQTVVRGIILMVNAVLLRRRQVVRPITRSPVILPVDHREGIPADILVIAVVMMNVRPVLLKTIPDHTQQQPNAVQDVTAVKLVHPVQALLIPDLMPERPNVTADRAVTDVTIPAAQDKNLFLVLLLIKKSVFPLPNAEIAVMSVNTTLIAP